MEVIIDQFKISDEDLIVDKTKMNFPVIGVLKVNRDIRYLITGIEGIWIIGVNLKTMNLTKFTPLNEFDLYKTGEIKLTIKV